MIEGCSELKNSSEMYDQPTSVEFEKDLEGDNPILLI